QLLRQTRQEHEARRFQRSVGDARRRSRRAGRVIAPIKVLMKVSASSGLIFLAVGIAVLGIILFLPPVRQDPSYHSFADQRQFWGIPNYLNVVSNLPLFVEC